MKRFQREILESLQRTTDRAARRELLEAHSPDQLGDQLCAKLYQVDPAVIRPWVTEWLARTFWHDTVFRELAARALEGGDEEFYFELYRKSFPEKVFRQDALRLCREVTDARRLSVELKRRHLDHEEGVVPAAVLLELLQLRGTDILAYLVQVVPGTRSWGNNKAFEAMAALAEARGWWGLWGVVVRHHTNLTSFSRLVKGLAEDHSRSDQEVAVQLSRAAGAATGQGSWRAPVPLSEAAALALYQRFPQLVRTVFAPHLIFAPKRRWGPHTDVNYEALARRAVERGDFATVDLLAAHGLFSNWAWSRNQVVNLGWYEAHYTGLSDLEFATRGLEVLGRIGEFRHYERLAIRQGNPLYRVFFNDPARYRTVAHRFGDFLEAPGDDIHRLGFRVLQEAEDRAGPIAADHLRHLCAYLLMEAPRPTRILAFQALALAAQHSEEAGRTVHEAVQAALSLRRRQYPRDRLIELAGRVIHAWPELGRATEQPTIYVWTGQETA